jgi:hypothetical protein
MKSLRLIEAAGQPDSGADQAPAFLCPGKATALVAEGDPRNVGSVRFQKESI